MQIPTTFTVYPDSQIGDVYGTEFTFTSNISSVYNSFVWNFGDGVKGKRIRNCFSPPGTISSAWTRER